MPYFNQSVTQGNQQEKERKLKVEEAQLSDSEDSIEPDNKEQTDGKWND